MIVILKFMFKEYYLHQKERIYISGLGFCTLVGDVIKVETIQN